MFNIKSYAMQVCSEFNGIPIKKCEVHKSEKLDVFLDMLISNGQLTVPVKNRRQGKRGRNSARNFLRREALMFARLIKTDILMNKVHKIS